MTNKRPSVSVFFPCYNDEKTIGTLVRNTFQILPRLTRDFEVIVVDDGSRDKSRDVLKKLTTKYKKLRLVLHTANRGYGGALKSGFKTAKKDLVFYTDGDGQYDVSELPILHMLMIEDISFVNGIKMKRQDPPHRVFFGNLHRFLMRWLFWLPITDVDCDFRLIKRNVIRKIKLEGNTGSICVELVKRAEVAGAKFREVDIHHYERPYGQSQFFKVDRILKTYIELFSLWFKLMIVDKFFRDGNSRVREYI